jgi:O-acetyl-ADP-ribose deacetylase (regulator of RNase III)
MLVKVVLCDINPKMVKAWRDTFEENPEVEVLQESMTEMQVSAWVTPTNSAGRMDGGLDLVIKRFLGDEVERLVQKQIKQNYGGAMPLGRTTCVPTGKTIPRYLISTPTMVGSNDDISDTLNVALACAAAFQAVHTQNEKEPGSIRSVALPGLGANTGRVPVEICADLMWTAYNLFRERSFKDFAEMRAALEEELGDLGPTTSKKAAAAAAASFATAAGKGNGKSHDEDFEDSDLDDDEEGEDGEEGEDEDEEGKDEDDDFDDSE